MAEKKQGPLAGFKLIEIAGIGPTQLAGMLLADMGADIVRITRPATVDLGVAIAPEFELMNRSRPCIKLDLKHRKGVETVLRLCEQADALFEGFRPGVMERLGLGPEICLSRNPSLVYGRMTGWGQEGPLAGLAGHDPNYVALAGALSLIGEKDGGPVYPLNLVGDFGGGGTYLAMGLLAALLETTKSGRGQVVDAAMVDGIASMLTMFHGHQASGNWNPDRGTNILDGGAHFFRPYRTRDNQYMVVASLEGRFYDLLLDKLEIDDPDLRTRQMDAQRWQTLARKLEAVFRTKTRDEWCAVFADSDACVTPVLSLEEAATHPHANARQSYAEVAGIVQPAPAPRFSRTPGKIQSPPPVPGENTLAVLAQWGMNEHEIQQLEKEHVLETSP